MFSLQCKPMNLLCSISSKDWVDDCGAVQGTAAHSAAHIGSLIPDVAEQLRRSALFPCSMLHWGFSFFYCTVFLIVMSIVAAMEHLLV